MIWRAVVIDVVLCVLMLTLSVMSDEQFWRVFYASGSLLAIIDAIWASRVLDAVEAVSYTHLTLPTILLV